MSSQGANHNADLLQGIHSLLTAIVVALGLLFYTSRALFVSPSFWQAS